MNVLVRASMAASIDVVGCSDDGSQDAGSGNTQASAATQAATGDETSDSAAELGCAAGAVGDTTDGATEPLMDMWGAACSNDADCAALGEGAICEDAAVIYELPGGYCTKPCSLPDTDTRFILDDPTCAPEGGVACIGAMGTFERCTRICTDDQQCNRDGYICRLMPLIARMEDPRACLMPDCCQGEC